VPDERRVNPGEPENLELTPPEGVPALPLADVPIPLNPSAPAPEPDAEADTLSAGAAAVAGSFEPVALDADLTEMLQQRARLAEDRLAEVLAAYRQSKQENEAHRERVTRTVEQRYEKRRDGLLLKFIDILDNLDRALEVSEQGGAGQSMIEGLILVRTQLLQTLQEQGLERIPVLGLPYDPETSEAVQNETVTDPDHHHLVVKDLMRGYRLNGRVVRHAKVAVGVYSEPSPEPQNT
jgi:molecular chaperone GrpE